MWPTTIPGATQSAIAVRGVGKCGKASVGRQTPSSASKTRTVLNCLAKAAPSSSQSCHSC